MSETLEESAKARAAAAWLRAQEARSRMNHCRERVLWIRMRWWRRWRYAGCVEAWQEAARAWEEAAEECMAAGVYWDALHARREMEEGG